ncbi:zinc-binding dehydrogenase [Halocalculus aciditolerans]|uniref:Quinone oxidoreductase n=1 Tax=Halocalculus aciditolerans TaxID=1383812 RepID=A0A830FFH2_9EURY|nr:zinc-binding dehydrogenase [Halocalculus aciditolerans]GGL48086.1 quinone oxidoreductase [Halocalculus aciditolerans]
MSGRELPETMDAQVIREHGGPDAFEPAELDVPDVEPNHVLVEVAATSVNPVDTKIRSGAAADLGPDLPAVLHGDVAGTVVAVGAGVDDFAVGDEVYGCPGGVAGTGGALAEYALADAASLAHKPDSLTMREAAALPLVTITAWDGLVTRADVAPGDDVLVHGGSGGVGHVAVQLAAREGGIVHATASDEPKRDLARNLGAQYAFDYHRDVADYVEEYTDGRGFDVVFDPVGAGAGTLEGSFDAASLKGHVVTTVARGDVALDATHTKGLSVDVVFMLIPLLHDDHDGRRYHRDILRRAASLVDDGDLRPLLDTETYGLDEISEAHRRLEAGEHVGKIVVDVAGE